MNEPISRVLSNWEVAEMVLLRRRGWTWERLSLWYKCSGKTLKRIYDRATS